MTVFEVPVVPDEPDFKMRIALDGERFDLRFHYNSVSGVYGLDVTDATGVALVKGVACVLGVDLLDSCVAANRPKGRLLMLDNTGRHSEAVLATFGTDTRLIYEAETV